MKTALLKDGIKEIKNSYKRFLSILLIVLLGVGFFAGLRATSPDMKRTLDLYFDAQNVMDIQVISTLGLTDEDVDALKEVQGVSEVEGAYQTDAIVTVGDEDVVVKLETYSDKINKLELVNGKLPVNSNECVVEERFLEETGHSIGDSIKIEVEDITNDDGEKQKVLKNDEVEIVGSVKSPLYIWAMTRGSTKLGSGVIDYYAYIPMDNINADIYTNIYITLAGAKELNTTSDDYSELVDNVTDNLEQISEERREARYNQLYDSANSKIEDAQKELDEEKKKAEKELEDARQEIEDGKKEIEDGKAEIETNRANANYSFSQAETEIANAEAELASKEEEFEATKKQVNKQIEEYEEQIESLNKTKSTLNTLNNSLDTCKKQLETLEGKLEQASSDEEKEELQAQIQEVNLKIQTLQKTIDGINEELKAQGITSIDKTIQTIRNGINTVEEKMKDAEEQIEQGKAQIQSSKEELNSKKSSTYYQLEQAEKEIEEAEEEIEKGEKELEKAQKEYDEKIKEAEDELLEAKEDLKEIERPEWYVLNREQNAGYASYIQDTDRVASLAEVFPIIFFLVAALISLTSMSRMVEEERVQIGTLKALGYRKTQIARKYVIYAVLATVIGGIIGLVIGFNFLPKIITEMYGMVYNLPQVVLEFNYSIASFGMIAATLCTVGATIYTCARQLRYNPATLMRPKAPKPGKRVLLEKIPFIWKHLNFTAKVTARNLFRYKKRFMMTIIGVCGCTSLIIAGFGLRESISNIIPMQYGEINKYNLSITLKEDKYDTELQELEDKLLENEYIKQTMGANVQSVNIIKDDNNQDIQLIVPEDVTKLGEYITLRDWKNEEKTYNLDNTGVVITQKLSTLLKIKEGDTITLENSDGDRAEVKVSGITENYIMHYIYMSPELYNTVYDTRIESNQIYVITENITEKQEADLGNILLQDADNISGVSFTSTTKDMFAVVMENMDMVVWILIISAGLLAIVVLYNLLNANISERIRELATIKVLGFYDREVYSYIARETIILTIIGILIGLIGGKFLITYILKTCELDITVFDPNVGIWSYVFGVLITIFFAIIVNIVTYFSLKKIDMIESLKSVE